MSGEQTPAVPLASAGPDWLMVGYQDLAGQYVVVASKDLTRAELSAVIRDPAAFDAGWVVTKRAARVEAFLLSARMVHMVQTCGASYAEALRTLLDFWDPEATDVLEIEP